MKILTAVILVTVAVLVYGFAGRRPEPIPVGDCAKNYAYPSGTFYSCGADQRPVVDEQLTDQVRDSLRHRADLFWALRTRILSDAEMDTVRRLGFLIATVDGTPYFEKDKRAEFREALSIQFKMRVIAQQGKPMKPAPEAEAFVQ